MKRIDRQDYRDGNLYDATQAGCDTIQLKYDGWWARIVVADGQARVFTRTCREVAQLEVNPLAFGTFIGEYMHGTQWAQKEERKGKFFLYDCWEINGQSAENFTYFERYNLLRVNIPLLGDRFRIVNNYPITAFEHVWKTFVDTNEYEGVVFRKRRAPVADTLWRQKKKVTKDLRVVGFERGEPGKKYEHTLGALIGKTPEGVTISVGGGFDDSERDAIWASQDVLLGRLFEVEGYAEFQSGSLRHPQFVRWREDLLPTSLRS